MKVAKIGIAVVLWAVVAGLGYWLYLIIQEPVEFQTAFAIRNDATVERLKDIRSAQELYLEANGEYANDWDKLVASVKLDSIMEIKTIGNPDDTLVQTSYDTIMRPITELVDFKSTNTVDSLRYIPFTNGTEVFSIEADIIKEQRVEIPVYQVMAFKNQYLNGLNKEFIDLEKDLILGSLNKASDAGNWE